mgnify:CR=1 FL=1
MKGLALTFANSEIAKEKTKEPFSFILPKPNVIQFDRSCVLFKS